MCLFAACTPKQIILQIKSSTRGLANLIPREAWWWWWGKIEVLFGFALLRFYDPSERRRGRMTFSNTCSVCAFAKKLRNLILPTLLLHCCPPLLTATHFFLLVDQFIHSAMQCQSLRKKYLQKKDADRCKNVLKLLFLPTRSRGIVIYKN